MKNIVVFIGAIFIALYSVPSQAKGAAKSSFKITSIARISSVKQLYDELLAQQLSIGDQIAKLSTTLHTASKSKAKTVTKQINTLTDDLAAIERRLSTFPVSLTDPLANNNTEEDNKKAFRRELDSIAEIRVAQSDPFAGRLSSDPQLDRMYRDYLSKSSVSGVDIELNNEDMPSGQTTTRLQESDLPQGAVYRVMIAISKTRIPESHFTSLDNVLEQSMPSGGYVYYQGTYDSMSQAQAACNKILSERQFRDAFVVAMKGTRRIPLR